MGLRTARQQKVHKVKAKNHITFMMIPDPTKGAKVVKVPKWVRFPFYALIIGASLGIILMVKHIADLEYQVASAQYTVITDSSSISVKDARIADLETTNSQHYEKLQTLQILAIELDEKLQKLEQQKSELDVKLNGAEQTTDAQPSEEVVVGNAPPIISISSNTNMITEQKNKDSFDSKIDDISKKLQASLVSAGQDSKDYTQLDNRLDELIPFWEAFPSGSPLNYLKVTDSYGWRIDPINFSRSFHTGVDFAANYVPIYATGNGTVEAAGYEGGYGKTILINQGYGYKTRYGHLSKILVSPGDKVTRGQQIAISGATGRVTGPHLHYEILYYGETQNPLDYIN